MVRFALVIRAVMVCSPLALAACAGGRSTPPVSSTPIVSGGPESGGIYKIGKPYQIEGLWYYPAEDYSYAQEGIASWYGTDFHGKRTANGDKYDMNEVTAAHPTLPMPSVVKVTNLDNGRILKVTVNDRGPFHSSRIIDLSRRAAQLLGFYEAGTARVRVEIDAQESINLKNIALKKNPPEMPQIAASPRGNVSSASLAPVVAGPIDSYGTAPSAAAKPVATPAAPKAAPAKGVEKAPAKAPEKPPTTVAAATGIFVQAGAFSEEANAHKLEQQLGELGKVHVTTTTVNNKKLYRVRLGPVADADAAAALVGKIKSYGYNDAKVVRE